MPTGSLLVIGVYAANNRTWQCLEQRLTKLKKQPIPCSENLALLSQTSAGKSNKNSIKTKRYGYRSQAPHLIGVIGHFIKQQKNKPFFSSSTHVHQRDLILNLKAIPNKFTDSKIMQNIYTPYPDYVKNSEIQISRG